MYQALYRKYRPQSFEDIVGQGHVTSTLAREVAEGRVAHAYLFAGPRGTGKTTTARILAKALNCENRAPNGSPDNVCESCLAITEGSSLDVMELDAASHNSVEDIRDMRLSVTTVASSANSRRVYILDEAHMLSKAAGNALLKTLEEPPEHVIFVLATTEPYKLLDTIRSRTQRFDFHPVGVEALAAHLARLADAEGYRADAAALVAVARHSGGSARDALSLLEQVAALGAGTVDVAGVHRTLGMADSEVYTRLADAIAAGDARSALELVAEMASRGIDLRRFIGEAIGFFRGVFLAHYSPNLAEVVDEPAEILESWKKASSRIGPADVLRAVDHLGEALVKLREGREERLMVELAMIRLTRPETATDPDALLARLERLERSQAPDHKPAARAQTTAGGPDARRRNESWRTRRQTPDARRQKQPVPAQVPGLECRISGFEPRTSDLEPQTAGFEPCSRSPPIGSMRSGPHSSVGSGRCSGHDDGHCFGRRRRGDRGRLDDPPRRPGLPPRGSPARRRDHRPGSHPCFRPAWAANRGRVPQGRGTRFDWPGRSCRGWTWTRTASSKHRPMPAIPTALLERELGATFVEEIVADRD